MSARSEVADSPFARANNAAARIRAAVSDRYDAEMQYTYSAGVMQAIISRHPDALAELEQYADTLENAEAIR